MANRSALTNSSVRHQVMLERLKTAEARDYNRLLIILQTQVTDVLSRLETPVQALTKARLNGLLRELRSAQSAALEKSNSKLMTRLRRIAAYEANFESESITSQTPRGVTIVAATGEVAWAKAVTTPLSATGDLLEPFLKDFTAREVSTINKLISRGWAEGWTNDEITRVLRGTKKLNYKDGLMSLLGKHNATLVRTAVQHVSSTAREATWDENEDIISGYRWVSTLDGRTTSQCRTLDGQEFKSGKGPRPPLHMNCRSTTVAVIKGFENLSDLLTRASKDGQVKGSLTYYDWLKTQSSEFQDQVLGSVKADLFRKGGLSTERFAQLQLGSAFQPLTLDQMRILEPRAFRRAGLGQ
jgi:SPP1 gp7 family putative phage head morphogenesis protein